MSSFFVVVHIIPQALKKCFKEYLDQWGWHVMLNKQLAINKFFSLLQCQASFYLACLTKSSPNGKE